LKITILIIPDYSWHSALWRLEKLYNRLLKELTEMGLITDYLWYQDKYGPKPLVEIIVGRKKIKEYAQVVLDKAEEFDLKAASPISEAAEGSDLKVGPINTIIAIGIGGLIGRYIAPKLKHVKKVILVGTPNLGLSLNKWVLLILAKSILRKVQCIKDSFPNSDFLKELNNEPPLSCKTFLVAGSKDIFVSPKSALGLPGVPENQKFLLPLEHSELIPVPTSKEQGAIEKIVSICKASKAKQSLRGNRNPIFLFLSFFIKKIGENFS